MQASVSPDLLRRFSPPPGLSRSAPRDVRLTAGGRVVVFFGWLLAIATVPTGVILYRQAAQQADAAATLAQRGVTGTAVIDRVWRKTGDGKPAFASFHFDANGTRVSGEARMNLSAWRELRAGSTVPVRYLPEDPRRAVVAGARVGKPLFVLAFLLPCGLAALALLCGFAVYRERTLLTDGRAAPAVVKSIKKRGGAHGSTHTEVAYEFPLQDGGVATGRASASKASVVGSVITVIYDPDHPKRNHPFPFSLVAPDVGDR